MGRQFVLRDEITVNAPLDRCFLLSTSVELVQKELRMQPVRGRVSGFVQQGDTILWKGWRLGLPQFHESVLEDFHRTFFFRDRMLRGRFARFEHDHNFAELSAGSVKMWDELRFTMRWGWLGFLAGRWLLVRHIRGLMRRRFAMLKRIAESEEWHAYLESPPPSC